MNYTTEKLEHSQIKFTIDINADELEQAIEEAYHATKHKYSVEGFRKGKVPRKVLENTYGKGIFIDDAVDIILPKYFGDAVAQEGELQVVARPSADIVDINDNGMKYTVTITVRPEVKLGEYKGLTIKKEKAEVTDEQVDAELKLAQDKQARVIEVEEGRAAEKGDIVNIDFKGFVDDKAFEGGEGSNYDLTLGSDMFIPGFEDQLIGAKKGEQKDVTVKFPADYHAAELADKDALFKVTVNAVKVKEIPVLDDEFAKDISEFDTLAEYKADIKAGLEKEAAEHAETHAENDLVDAIVAASEVEVPEVMVDEQVDEMIKEFEYRLMYQGIKLEDYMSYAGINQDQLKEQYKTGAEQSVKARLVMEEVIKVEGIKVEDAEVDEKIADIAKKSGKTLEEYKKDMDERYINYLYSQVINDKLMAMLKANNNIE